MDTVKLRRWLATFTLALHTGLQVGAAFTSRGDWLRLFAVFSVALTTATVGVFYRALWARWLAMGIAATTLLDVAVLTSHYGWFGGLLIYTVLPVIVLACLCGPRMAAHFASAPWTEMWTRVDRRLTMLKLAIILSVPAVAGLLRYTLLNRYWIGELDVAVALGSAALFAFGAIATVAKRTVGPILLLAPAFASFGLATEAWFRLQDGVAACGQGMVTLSLVGWLPGVVATLGAFAALALPMWRFLQRGGRPPAH